MMFTAFMSRVSHGFRLADVVCRIPDKTMSLQVPVRRCYSKKWNVHSSRQFHISDQKLQENRIEEQILEQKKRNEEAGELTELIRDFLDPAEFYRAVRGSGIEFFCGVPDSLLKDFCAYVTDHTPSHNHIITPNEGAAVAVATGYHLATNRTAMVYLQNSGIGNTVNPIMSLASPSVYSIPMLLLVGWRGEPGKRDEPQHLVQGQATPGLLASLHIPFQILPDYEEGAEQVLHTAKQYMETTGGPYCLLVRRQTFLPYKLKTAAAHEFPLSREEAMKSVVDTLRDKDVVISTTGMVSRELFEYRVAKGQGHERDFLTVGSMGHASSIALGVALSKPKRQVFCLDGDGAAIMHLGAMASIGAQGLKNFKHVILNNGSHDSVGGQPTDAQNFDTFSFTGIAKACGYKDAWMATTEAEVKDMVQMMRDSEGPVLLEIRTRKGSRKTLGRPTTSPAENKSDLMHFLAIG
ncbi:phosphonopyruvate decarboxylase-like [Liolophura sinensis]|uniref:phosphonopyruvate decarboxylase-like n=1 Tax=Liolophura sinensis TaxID=3198878 RepID=UPI0031584080